MEINKLQSQKQDIQNVLNVDFLDALYVLEQVKRDRQVPEYYRGHVTYEKFVKTYEEYLQDIIYTFNKYDKTPVEQYTAASILDAYNAHRKAKIHSISNRKNSELNLTVGNMHVKLNYLSE